MSVRDADEIMEAEYAEQEMLRKAIEAADRIICEGCDGDNDKLLLLTVKVACAFAEKTRIMAQQVLNRKEFLQEAGEGKTGV